MAYKFLTSIWGRRLGLQRLSTGESGGTSVKEYLVGPEAIRFSVSTAETTSVNLAGCGISRLTSASSGVFTLDPPVPGVMKFIDAPAINTSVYIKTANAETITSSQNSSGTTLKSTTGVAGSVTLVGVSTSEWAAVNLSGFTSTTST